MKSTNSWPKRRKLTSKPDLEMSMFDLGDVDHTQLKDQMREVAAAAVAELPAVLKLLTDTLRSHDPLGILAAFTFYGLTTMVGSKGVSDQKLLKDILPHHAELLQALVLTVPFEEWGTHPLTPSVMQTMFDTVPKLADIFFFQRALEGNKISDEQQFTVLSLQERIRMHTHAVRNWGYFEDVIKISLDLYAPLDQEFAARHGFTCTEVIKTMAALVPEPFCQSRENSLGQVADVLAIHEVLADISRIDRLVFISKGFEYVTANVPALEQIGDLPSGSGTVGSRSLGYRPRHELGIVERDYLLESGLALFVGHDLCLESHNPGLDFGQLPFEVFDSRRHSPILRGDAHLTFYDREIWWDLRHKAAFICALRYSLSSVHDG